MMLTDQELQSLRNLGNEAEAAADEIDLLRAALDGLAFAAHQSGENGLAFLADCDDVAAWIDAAMPRADDAISDAVCAALERRAEYDSALVAAERERWRASLSYAVKEADGWFDDCRGGRINTPEMNAARALLRA